MTSGLVLFVLGVFVGSALAVRATTPTTRRRVTRWQMLTSLWCVALTYCVLGANVTLCVELRLWWLAAGSAIGALACVGFVRLVCFKWNRW